MGRRLRSSLARRIETDVVASNRPVRASADECSIANAAARGDAAKAGKRPHTRDIYELPVVVPGTLRIRGEAATQLAIGN